MSALQHFTYLESDARVDLARELRRVASELEGRAGRIEAGERVGGHLIRTDLRSVEDALLAHDKASAALDGAKRALECGGASEQRPKDDK